MLRNVVCGGYMGEVVPGHESCMGPASRYWCRGRGVRQQNVSQCIVVVPQSYVEPLMMGRVVLQVPIVTSSTVATVNVTIQGESAVMSKETKVLIAPPAFLHLIVTDKPLYKPGQTGTHVLTPSQASSLQGEGNTVLQ